MSSPRQWLDHFCTLLIERERTLSSWQDLARETIPVKARRSFHNILKAVWAKTENRAVLEKHILSQTFADQPRFYDWWARGPFPLPPALEIAEPEPALDTSQWALPELPTLTSLAEFLALHPDDFNWLTSPRAHHYHEQWLPKKRGGRRLLESPKPLLKQSQRTLLHHLLQRIPPHEAATGFQKGKNILDFVRPHTGKSVVLKMDLANFFPSIGRVRVKRSFMALGYRESVAFALANLTTTRCAKNDLTFSEKKLYQTYHLPQGAPTSPALANLAAFRFDCRLSGLARAVGADYTRYADDLLFSGEQNSPCHSSRFQTKIAIIALQEGFQINHRKTQTMPQSQRQSAAGLILNEKANARRAEYDRLKAILHNCQRFGPASQNHQAHPQFEAHLRGRVEWLSSLNPKWGEKLRNTCQHIDWSS